MGVPTSDFGKQQESNQGSLNVCLKAKAMMTMCGCAEQSLWNDA